jgi:hypothetical protein
MLVDEKKYVIFLGRARRGTRVQTKIETTPPHRP